MAIPHFSIFGLSGVGKTTFVEDVCRDAHFFQPSQTVTRAPRSDDNRKKFCYVSQAVFNQLKWSNQFFIEDSQGVNYYGYQKSSFKPKRGLVLYGLPALVEKTKALGGICILIVGDAQKGLDMRNDSLPLREQRSKGNLFLQARYYGNPYFLAKMDLILTNEIGQMEKIITLFKFFAAFKYAESSALRGNTHDLVHVLKMYHHPLQGMRYDMLKHTRYVQKAFRNEALSLIFYSNVIKESRYFLT